MPFVSFLDETSGLGELMAREPARYRSFVEFSQHILTGPSELSKGERETIGAFVSALNQCKYCTGTHSAIAKAYGVATELVDALLGDLAGAPVDAKLRPVLQYAKKLTEDPARLTQADADAVTAAGWSEQTLSDTVAVTALFAMANRLVDGHGIEGLPPAMNEMIGEQVVEHGYVMPAERETSTRTGAAD